MSRALRGILGVAVLTSRWAVRQPAWLLQDALLLVAFGIILWAWGGVEAARSIVIAWIVGGMWSLGINLVGQEVGWSRVIGTLHMYVASPITPRIYMLGMLLGNISTIFPIELAIITGIAYMLGSMELILAAMAAGLLLAPVSTMLGLSIAMRIRKPTNVSAITNPIAMVLMLLPPVFYPIAVVPGPLRPVALAIPTAAAAELARALAGYHNYYTTTEPLVALVLWALAAVVLASRTVKWGHE